VNTNGTLHLLGVSDINQGYITSIQSALYQHILTTDEVSVSKCHGRRVTHAAVSLTYYSKYKKCEF
jgi:1,6-anhydro-N-acetylmuramate kinase